ncbi:MAG TPA: carboxypeptidase regulatory-like domain-containing protein, partial [Blastocatellia bacterium]|nr:carboxypeptidase regulatory-like domain-containing protein [Blastocatellia bacterium]
MNLLIRLVSSRFRQLDRTTGVLLSTLFVLAFSAGNCLAQTGGATITGTVVDQAGAAIAGVKVQLMLNGVVKQTTLSAESGAFKFAGVPFGTYQLHTEFDGFEPASNDLTVNNKTLSAMKITMSVAAVRQETTVKADDSKISNDTSENQNAIAVDNDTLTNLPVFDQDYVTTLSRFLDSGDLATGGVTLVVDGIEVNDLGVSASAVKQIKINNDPYSPEYARPGRGRIEITTEPGSLEYHGTFNFIFRDSLFNAREPFALVRPPEQRRIYEGVFTGPVRHSKKTSFLLSVDRDEEDVQSVVFALGPKGTIQEDAAAPMRNLLTAGRISHNFSENNKASWFFSYQDRSNKNQGVGGITLPEAGTNRDFKEYEFRFNEETVLTPRLVNQLRFLAGHYYAPTTSVDPAHGTVVLGTFVGGGAQADQVRSEYHVEFTEELSYSLGKQTIKGGINVPDLSRRGIDNNLNQGGTFYFSSLADFENSHPYSFVQQQGNGRVVFLEKVLGVFANDEIRVTPNLMVSAGLRYYWQNYFADNDSFAPRLSFAYAPRGSQKTVIRGGAGIFYDRTGPSPISDLLLFNGNRLRMYVLSNPGFPNPLSGGGSLTGQPVSVTRLDSNFTMPYTIQYSVGVERQVQKAATLSLTYQSTRGIDRFRSRDINAPLGPLYLSRPDPNFGVIRQIESSGRSMGESLEVSFRGRLSKYFSGMAQYRLAWAYDNTSGITSYPANNYDLTGEWGRSDWDRRHRFELLGTATPGKQFNV